MSDNACLVTFLRRLIERNERSGLKLFKHRALRARRIALVG